jgi:hypothetical protein
MIFFPSPFSVRAELVEALPFFIPALEEKGSPSTSSGPTAFVDLHA